MPKLLRFHEQVIDLEHVYAVEALDPASDRHARVHLDLAPAGAESTFEVRDNDAYRLIKALYDATHDAGEPRSGSRLGRFDNWYIDTSRIVRMSYEGRAVEVWLLLPRDRVVALRLEGNAAYDLWHEYGKRIPMAVEQGPPAAGG